MRVENEALIVSAARGIVSKGLSGSQKNDSDDTGLFRVDFRKTTHVGHLSLIIGTQLEPSFLSPGADPFSLPNVITGIT